MSGPKNLQMRLFSRKSFQGRIHSGMRKDTQPFIFIARATVYPIGTSVVWKVALADHMYKGHNERREEKTPGNGKIPPYGRRHETHTLQSKATVPSKKRKKKTPDRIFPLGRSQ